MKFDKRYLLALLPLLLVGAFMYYFSEIFFYIIIGWVLSMIGAPLVKFLKRFLGKNLAAAITLGVFMLFFGLLIWIFVPAISTQARNLAGIDYTKIVNSLEEPINDWEMWLAKKGLIEMPEDDQQISPKTERDRDLVYTEIIDVDSLVNARLGKVDTLRPRENLTLLVNIDAKHLLERDAEAEEHEHGSFFENAKKSIYSFLNPKIIPTIFRSVVGTLGNFLVGFMSVLFIAFFFLREQGLFNTMIASVVPDEYEYQTVHAVEETSRLLIRYFIGILVQVTVITIFMFILLKILGIKNALLIAFFAALMNVIPYVGPIIGATFGAIITISSNLDVGFYDTLLPMLIKVFVAFFSMQLLDNFILQPNIFSKSVKAHPLEIFLVVLLGAEMGGVAGMVLAIPLYTVIRVVAKVFLSEFKVVQLITKSL